MPVEVEESLPKIRSEIYRPDLTRLPDITYARRVIRFLVKNLLRLILWLFAEKCR